MKKWIVAAGAVLCAVLAAAFVLQIKFISLGNGERLVVYTPLPGQGAPGGSAHADLQDQLIVLYGEADVRTRKAHRTWQGEAATVYDTSGYDFEYLGRSVAGGDYFLCRVTTVRSVILDGGGGEAVSTASRTCTYIGYDDGDIQSSVRAKVLWETLREEYSDSKAYFDELPLPD